MRVNVNYTTRMRKSYLFTTILSVQFLFAASYYCQVPTAGLVAHYALDGNALDSSPNGHDGINNGAVPFPDRNGMANGAMYFNGQQEIKVIDHPDFSFTNHIFAFSAWIYDQSGVNQNAPICGKMNQLDYDWEYSFRKTFANRSINPNVVAFNNWNLTGKKYPYLCLDNTISPNATCQSGVWEHWVATADGDSLRVYKNCVLQYTVGRDYTAGMGNGSGNFTIGSAGAYQEYWFLTGALDDIRVYSVSLTPNQVCALFNEKNDQTITEPEPIIKDDEAFVDVLIYPNPSTGAFSVRLDEELTGKNYLLEIRTQGGQLIFTKNLDENESNVDIGKDIPPGVYFMILKNDTVTTKPKRLVIH